jgi:hypothetical protein
MWREAMTFPKGRPPKKVDDKNGDNITIKPKRGTDRSYTLARLKRPWAIARAPVIAAE